MINPVTQSKIDYLVNQRALLYADIQQLREYAEGEQNVILTNKEKIRLVGDDGSGNPARDVEFHLNVCKTCINVEADRLEVRDITVTVPQPENAPPAEPVEGETPTAPQGEAIAEEAGKKLSAFVWDRWKDNRMDERQRGAHKPAIRDGDSFAILYWDGLRETGKAKIALHEVYDGVTSGVDMYYVDNDPSKPVCAVKIWIAKETNTVKVRRKNIYYEDRVEKWISDGGMSGAFQDANWRPLRYGDDDFTDKLVEVDAISRDSGSATVEWWTETGTAPVYNGNNEWVTGGKPLGLPVFHFRHDADGKSHGTSTISDLVPGLQDAINDCAMSVRVAEKLTGFKSVWATGFDPNATTFSVYPGSITYNAEDGSFGQFAESDLRQLLEVKDSFIKDAATLTDTPLTYFNLSGVIPAEGTQQSLELALLAKTRRNQTSFGNTWEDVFKFMLKLEKTWGVQLRGYSPELLESISIDCEWKPGAIRNEREETEIAKMHKDLGVPDRWVWKLLGYTEDEIDQFENDAQTKRGQVLGSLAQQIAAMEAQNNAVNAAANQQPGNAGANGRAEPIGTERST